MVSEEDDQGFAEKRFGPPGPPNDREPVPGAEIDEDAGEVDEIRGRVSAETRRESARRRSVRCVRESSRKRRNSGTTAASALPHRIHGAQNA